MTVMNLWMNAKTKQIITTSKLFSSLRLCCNLCNPVISRNGMMALPLYFDRKIVKLFFYPNCQTKWHVYDPWSYYVKVHTFTYLWGK